MAEKLTPQQQQAVNDRGGMLLVSAAAGSGKTKVLVDRLMSYLTAPVNPANLDDFLIITYTKAAASELRGKIASKLSEKIAADPTNRHLQHQMQRLYLAKISTIHAFCSDLLREFAFRLDVAADFRMADEIESTDLQIRAMEQALEMAYAEADEDFLAFIDTQGLGRDDRQIPQIVLDVYEKSRCHLDPDKWLDECVASTSVTDVTDAAQTVWGSYLVKQLYEHLDMQISSMEHCATLASNAEYMEKPAQLLRETVSQLKHLRNSNTWDEIISRKDIDYGVLRFDKKCEDLELIEKIKTVRSCCKDEVAKKLKCFCNCNEQVLSDVASTAPATRGLVSLVKTFARAYHSIKRSRRVVDFSDLEHMTLDLLIGKDRSAPTALADEIGGRFREVMVDEYQDSNAVQDRIFYALTHKRSNCFMVGDVKQSIYQFRLADPGIFLDKYRRYVPADEAVDGQGRKVILSSNFRSSAGVINGVNDVFTNCMSEQVGGLSYGEDESLKEGIPHVALPDREVELYAVDVQADTYREEAAFVADRITEMLKNKSLVRDGDGLRQVSPDDIVILLRSPNSVGMDFRLALESRGVRCVTGSSNDLLQTEEIMVLRSLLQVISNPQQDIPLTAVLMSRVFEFTADDIAAVRGGKRSSSMYDVLRSCDDPKAKSFITVLSQLRTEARICTLSHLVVRVLQLTMIDSIYSAMPDGESKVENIQTFSQLATTFESNAMGDLERFLDYLTSLEEKGFAVNEENSAGAVRIMSIHKSKGLEFPVVFLCGLSKGFNTEDARAPVLCDSELGFGLCCADLRNRIKYPTVARNAISAKMTTSSISEEMRVLYVAMTRARDRLIMTYAQKKPENRLSQIANRLGICPRVLLTGGVSCAGDWVLMTAMQRAEATAFFKAAVKPERIFVHEDKWLIDIVTADIDTQYSADMPITDEATVSDTTLFRMQHALAFKYPSSQATVAPSKLTATQLKGREKDREAAEGTHGAWDRSFRKPSFIEKPVDGKSYGVAMHTVMQHIRYECCADKDSIAQEVQRLILEGHVAPEYEPIIDLDGIAAFFASDLGAKLKNRVKTLREFKFSVLVNGARYYDGLDDEEILLQGVVDCAIVEDDGLSIIDFKTDFVTEQTLSDVVKRYEQQVQVYAYAMQRIYQLPVKHAKLYFFRLRKLVSVL